MYFKVSMRTNPETGVYSGYYRLVESYRNCYNRVCHRTILNAFVYFKQILTCAPFTITKTKTQWLTCTWVYWPIGWSIPFVFNEKQKASIAGGGRLSAP